MCRLATGLALLLVMLGLPVAPVVCELACPQSAEPAASDPRPRVVASPAAAPCHERATGQPAHDAPPAHTAALAGAAAHGCDHPAVISSRATHDGFRLRAPEPGPVIAALHSAAAGASHAPLPPSAPDRPPTPVARGAFSPVLRI